MAEEENYLPDRAEEIESLCEKELFEYRTIFFHEDVDADEMLKIIKKILWLDLNNNQPITIHVDSDGGDVYAALALYDCVRTLKSKVNIHVSSKAFSAAAFIVACCATGHRTCGKHSTFMYHPGESITYGRHDDMKADTGEVDRVEKVYDRLVAKHTKLTMKDVNSMFRKNVWFDARQAVKWGWVDEIL